MQRRDFIKSTAAGWLFLQTQPVNALTNSTHANERANKKIVWVMLRGAMDSLHALQPLFDKHLLANRAPLITPTLNSVMKIDRDFALHPAFKHIQEWYEKGDVLPVVAVATGYRNRSHFDGQDQMESGLNATDHDDGWLARAANARNTEGLAISQTIPIALRGADTQSTWYPSQFAPVDNDLLERLVSLYEEDTEFGKLLKQSVENRDKLSMNDKSRKRPRFPLLAKRCGELLSQSRTAQCAMLEMNGWDTHNSQITRLNRQFGLLDEGLQELKTALGEQWRNTVVIVTSEFGRTVAMNGTQGTDHGTGSAAFFLGGAIKGKRVLGDWPGLAPENLYENRDLMPTSDVRSWIASVLHQHWGLSVAQLKQVFPDVLPVTQVLIN